MASPAASHAIALLQLLARRGAPQPAASLARDLGIPRSSTYRLLGVLREAGFVSHAEGDRRWGLGVAAYELGSAYTRQQPLQRIARPALSRLVALTGQNAHLAVLHGHDVLYVIEERAPGRPLLVTDVGVRLPASLTASGMAMLARLPAAQLRALYPTRDDFVQRGGRGPTSLSALRSELAQVRRRGYAIEDGTVTAGFESIAFVITDHAGLPSASVAVTWATDSLHAQAAAEVIDACRHTAAEVSRRLGG